MKCTCWILKSIIFLVIFLNVGFIIGSENITVDFPEEVIVGEEFDIEILLQNFSESSYDIKLEIVNGTHNIADVQWDGVWSSTFFWIEDAINTSEKNKETFLMRIEEEYSGKVELVVKIRNQDVSLEFDEYEFEVLFLGEYEAGEDEIFLEMSWDDEDIVNYGEEFDVLIEATHLRENEYDVRVWITFEDNDTVISETYNEEEDTWISGNFYVNELFKGPKDARERITLRLKEEYDAYIGDAKLYFKLRDHVQIEESIEILAYKIREEIVSEPVEVIEEVEDIVIENDGVILLGAVIDTVNASSESIKSTQYVVYESASEKMKQYAVYGFALLCVVLCVLFAWNKLE
jgi:hypothetical protein